jgi:transglutaminase-like putative cysteine protease
MPSTGPDPSQPAGNALDRVRFEPVPEWVLPHEVPDNVVRKDGDALTQLLIDQQHHLASRSVYQRQVIRLENLEAVQHLSQWTLDYSPLTQEVRLHELKVTRNGESTQYALPGNIRLLNRERNLESFIVDGLSTLLIVLADIRVGDVLEQSLTITTTPLLLKDDFFNFYALPQQTQIGAFHYSVTAPTGQLPSWRGSESMGQPEQTSTGAEDRLRWTLESVSRFESEPNIPSWYLPPAWLQLSTAANWETISSAAAQAWPKSEDAPGIEAFIARVKTEHASQEARIEAVLRFVQDDFRYLSVTESMGGQIPSAPETVLNRRYGDCKDLSLLLTECLTRLGVRARPVVVSQAVGKAVPDLLPSLNLFNHAIVSFFHGDDEYWVDATAGSQGGGPFKRSTGDFFHGLPLEETGCGLTPQPALCSDDTYHIYDTLLLDSVGGHSLLRTQITATGCHADHLRNQLHRNGEDGFGEYLLNRTQERYKVEQAMEKPLYEDDREQNIWRMVELYQLPALRGSRDGVYGLSLPDCLPLAILPYPDEKKRRAPFAMPRNIDIRHTVEMRSSSNKRQPGRAERAQFKDIDFSVDTRLGNECWKHSVSLKSTTDHILPEDIVAFRMKFQRPIQEAGFGIQLLKGYRRPSPGKDFFTLPPLPVAESAAASKNRAVSRSSSSGQTHKTRSYSSSHRPRRSHRQVSYDSGPQIQPWMVGAAIGVIVAVVKVIYLLATFG